MSYLSQPTSTLDYGVVKVGNYIDVIDGIISNSQDLSANASPSFGNVSVTGNLKAGGNLVVTSVTPTAGYGISVSNVVSGGYNSLFIVVNTGVVTLYAGPGINLTGTAGNITVSATGAWRLI